MSNYTGTDNLEIMAEAVNYNHYLEALIVRYSRGGDRVLDFGAGIGTFAGRMLDRGIDISALEIDPAQAEVIRQKNIATYISSNEIDVESFDYIYSLNVLEHIENDHAALRDLHRCLDSGGRILVYVPALQILYSSMDKKVGHYRRYSRKTLRRVAQLAGFRVTSCFYVDCLGVLASLMYKYSGNKSGSINKRALIVYDRIVFPISRLLDRVFCRLFGKNVFAVLEKD